MASGLLPQFKSLPDFDHQNHSLHPMSMVVHDSNGNDSGVEHGKETEEITENAETSTVIGFPQSANKTAHAVPSTGEEFQMNESMQGQGQHISILSDSNRCHESAEGVSSSLPEMPDQPGFSQVLGNKLSFDAGTFESRAFQFDLQELADISLLDLDHDLIEVSKHCVTASGSSEMIPVRVPNAPGLTPIRNAVECSDQSVDMLIYKCDCCLVILAEAENSACLSFRDLLDCSAICNLDEHTVSSHYQCSNSQGSEISESFAMQSVHPPGSDLLETSSCQIPHAVSFPDDDSTPFGTEPECKSLGTTEQEPVKCSPADLIHASDPASSPCDNCSDRFGPHIQPNDEESSKSVHLDTYVLRPSDILKKLPSTDEKTFMHAEQIESGDIFNEISSFSSLDVPFFSCDLILTNSTHQQEYSPLDRQMIMSPMACFSPIGLWDSPSQDASHETDLRNAVKTFASSPHILKKRQHALLTPSSQKRCEKKIGNSMNHGFSSTESLIRDFSCLDLMFGENDDKASFLSPKQTHRKNSISYIEDKENSSCTPEMRKEWRKDPALTNHPIPGTNIDGGCLSDKIEKSSNVLAAEAKVDVDSAAKVVKQCSGILVPSLFSPDRAVHKMDRTLCPTARTPGSPNSRQLEIYYSKFSPGNSSFHNIVSGTAYGKKNDNCLDSITPVKSAPSLTPFKFISGSSGNEAGINNIFLETPYKRGNESLSVMNSPWIISSFLPGLRTGTKITTEDIRNFMSPGGGSYDATGLMGHFNNVADY